MEYNGHIIDYLVVVYKYRTLCPPHEWLTGCTVFTDEKRAVRCYETLLDNEDYKEVELILQ